MYAYMCVYVCVCVYMFMCMCVFVCVCVCVCMHVCCVVVVQHKFHTDLHSSSSNEVSDRVKVHYLRKSCLVLDGHHHEHNT